MYVQSRSTILVVEDDRELAAAIGLLLVGEGHLMLLATSAEEALALLRSTTPCLLLWDPLSVGACLDVLAESALRGVPVATLPIGVATTRSHAGSEMVMTRRLTSAEAVLGIVRTYCPHQEVPSDQKGI